MFSSLSGSSSSSSSFWRSVGNQAFETRGESRRRDTNRAAGRQGSKQASENRLLQDGREQARVDGWLVNAAVPPHCPSFFLSPHDHSGERRLNKRGPAGSGDGGGGGGNSGFESTEFLSCARTHEKTNSIASRTNGQSLRTLSVGVRASDFIFVSSMRENSCHLL